MENSFSWSFLTECNYAVIFPEEGGFGLHLSVILPVSNVYAYPFASPGAILKDNVVLMICKDLTRAMVFIKNRPI